MSDDLCAVTLMPCPFCGGEASLYQNSKEDGSGDYDADAWFVRCDPCDLIHDLAWAIPKADAIAAWNTRLNATTDQSAEIAMLREALEAFAEATEDLDDVHADSSDIWEAPAAMSITAGDLRRARTALNRKEGQ